MNQILDFIRIWVNLMEAIYFHSGHKAFLLLTGPYVKSM